MEMYPMDNWSNDDDGWDMSRVRWDNQIDLNEQAEEKVCLFFLRKNSDRTDLVDLMHMNVLRIDYWMELMYDRSSLVLHLICRDQLDSLDWYSNESFHFPSLSSFLLWNYVGNVFVHSRELLVSNCQLDMQKELIFHRLQQHHVVNKVSLHTRDWEFYVNLHNSIPNHWQIWRVLEDEEEGMMLIWNEDGNLPMNFLRCKMRRAHITMRMMMRINRIPEIMPMVK